MRILLLSFLIGLLSASCSNNENTEASYKETPVSNHSHANIEEINTVHLHLDLNVDFDNKILKGIARHQMSNHGTNKAIFDIKGLKINKVTSGELSNEEETQFTTDADF